MGSYRQTAIGIFGIGMALMASPVHAEPAIVPANDGLGTTVQQQGNQYNIGGGTRSGDNLFHSFQRLGLSPQEIANFLATPDLRAIVGRVTGGEPSVIEGLIRISGGQPNLYLMNPAGILFGAGARLDVPASFMATTADRLGFSDGGWFSAQGPVDFRGLSGSLQWLDFVSDRPGHLLSWGSLAVGEGQNLWLLGGGSVVSTGRLQAPGGNVTVAAIPGTNRVRIAPDGSTLTLEVALPEPGAIGGRSLAELLAGSPTAAASQLVINPDGSVLLQSAASGPVALPDRGVVVAGNVDSARSTGPGGSITIGGDRVGLVGANLEASGPQGGGRVQIGGSERGSGNLFSAWATWVDRASQIQANATDRGAGGQVIVWADGLTWYSGAIAARGGPNGGPGGFVELSAKGELAVRGTVDLTAPLGPLGTLLLDPQDIRIVPGVLGSDDSQLSSNVPFGQPENQILRTDQGFFTGPPAPVDFTISEGRLELLLSTANLILEAERDIVLENLLDDRLSLRMANGGSVRFTAGRDVRFLDSADVLSTLGAPITIQAGEAISIGRLETQGGAIDLSAGSSITTGSLRTTGNEGGPITLNSSSGSITTGDMNTIGGAINLSAPGNLTTGAISSQGPIGGQVTLRTSGGAIATGAITSSGSQSGGAVTLNGSTGVTVGGNLQAIGNNGSGGGVTIDSSGPIALSGDLSTSAPVIGVAGNVAIASSNNSAAIAGLITAAGNGGGNITLTAQRALSFGSLSTQGQNAAGSITLISATDQISGGNLNASGNSQGGNLQARARTGISLGTLNLSAIGGNGGNANLTLTGPGDVQITSLNAQGGSDGRGGSVDIVSTRFFRALGAFIDRSGVLTSIATGGSQGGNAVRITHGGGSQTPVVPLVVGETPSSGGNGLAGGVSTGSSTISTGSFPGPFTQGNIEFITTGEPVPTPTPTPTPSPSPTPSPTPTPSPSPTPTPSPSPTPTPSPSPTPTPSPSPTPTPSPSPTPTPVVEPEAEGDRPDPEAGRIVQQRPMGNGGRSGDNLAAIEQVARRQIIDHLKGGASDRAAVEIDRLYTTLTNGHLGRALSNDVQSFPDLQGTLRRLESKTGLKPAILYTFARPEQLDVILVIPDAPPIYRVVREAPRDRVLKAVIDLRAAITTPVARISNTYRPPAEQLYRWIVGPVAEELVRHQVDTIAFSMDRGMRSLPVSVLHDGQQFLIEKYSVGLIPSINLTDTQFEPIRSAPVLSFGASEFTDLPPLPAVPVELATIQRLIPRDKTFLNEEFNLENLKRQRRSNPFPILHLATHADFRPGSPQDSFVRLWDRRLAVSDLRYLGLGSPPVELLVLSACRTAIGDESAELGFAGFAVDAGVKSVVASLWYVSDEGTLGLMAGFYDALRSAPIKAEALRRAQVAMLRGQTRAEDGRLVFPGGVVDLPPESSKLATFSLAHPYYWASFTTIGSPW